MERQKRVRDTERDVGIVREKREREIVRVIVRETEILREILREM